MDQLIFCGYEIASAFIPFLIAFALFRNVQKKRGISFSKCDCIAEIAFCAYITGVLHVTGAGTLYDGLVYQLEIRQDQLNFVPFSQEIDIAAYLLNVLLFLPLGFLVPLIWRKMDRFVSVFGAGLLFTMLIETSQLLTPRRTDIDDIILNAAGAAVGFVLHEAWDKCTNAKFRLYGAVVAELPVYILVMFGGRFLIYYEMGLARLIYGF